MRATLKNAVALSIAALAVFGSLNAASRLSNQVEYWQVDSGLTLAYQDGQVVVGSVMPGSAGEGDGIVAGVAVTEVNGILISILSPAERQNLVNAPPARIDSITVASVHWGAVALQNVPADGYPFRFSTWYRTGDADLAPMFLGLAIIAGGWWLLRTGRAGPVLRPFAVTLPVATALPLLLSPLDQYPGETAAEIVSVLLVAGTLPLAFDFAALLATRSQRYLARLGALGLGAGAFGFGAIWFVARALGYLLPYAGEYTLNTSYLPSSAYGRFVLVALMSLVPGILAARPIGWGLAGRDAGSVERDARSVGSVASSPRRFVESSDLALAAVTPAVAGLSLTGYDHQTWPIVLWLVGLFVARRFGIQPLRQLVQRTSRQRDLVVSATERERARIAADIHDYALQDLTMLVRRLDSAGDTENATAARDVADRLRAICGDLRLPILDDLGVGPALDWLVDRLEPDSERLDLELSDRERRLAPEAELAFFRVAQEAIANALHHGAPPITVRYWGGGDWAELIVDDVGPGIPVGAAEAAERSGHMGLMNMAQRAGTIGAELTFGRRPGGGTRVHMVWEGKLGERIGELEDSLAPAVKREVEPA
jgi:signal transduction histidine kinase